MTPKTLEERDEMVLGCRPLAIREARRAYRTGATVRRVGTVEDAESVAVLALFVAADGYDPARAAFTTYAALTARRCLARAGLNDGLPRLPSRALQREATRDAARRALNPKPLDYDTADTAARQADPADAAERADLHRALWRAVNALPREQRVVIKRWLAGQTWRQIGKRYKMCHQTAWNRYDRGLAALYLALKSGVT